MALQGYADSHQQRMGASILAIIVLKTFFIFLMEGVIFLFSFLKICLSYPVGLVLYYSSCIPFDLNETFNQKPKA